MHETQLWHQNSIDTIDGYHRMIRASIDQLTDEQIHQRLQPQFNSVATLLRHLAGNLESRWTNFLEEDGEKSTRDRDLEFEDWQGDRASLESYFESSWNCFRNAVVQLKSEDFTKQIKIRGEAHSVPKAILRSLTHVSYHVGQIVLIARLVHGDEQNWNWLTIQPGQSKHFNKTTWGTSASRGVAGGQ